MTATMTINGAKLIAANPVNGQNQPVTPSAQLAWTPVDPSICSVEVTGANNIRGWIHPLAIGSTVVNISGVDHTGGEVKTTPFTVVVTEDGDIDHFVPAEVPA